MIRNLKSKLLLLAGGTAFLFASCNNVDPQAIVKKWQLESFQSPTVDSIVAAQKHSIDTMSSVDSMTAMMLGSFNLDTVKARLKSRIDVQKEKQESAAALSALLFLKNGLVIHFNGSRHDTTKWEIVNSNELVLSPYSPRQKQAGAKPDTSKIAQLDANNLKLKVKEHGKDAYVKFHAYTTADSLKADSMLTVMQQQMQQQMQMRQQMQQQMQNQQAQSSNKPSK